MTRNNLANQLAWLLSNTQLSRPTGPPLPAVHDLAFDSFSRTPTATPSLPSQQSASQLRGRQAPPPPAASSSSASLRTNRRTDFDFSLDEDDTFMFDDEENEIAHTESRGVDMKRLTTKSSKKPSLVSKQEQQVPPPKAGIGRLQQAYSASLLKNQPVAKTSTSAPAHGRSRTPSWIAEPPKPAARDRSHDLTRDLDEDMHDLTGTDKLDASARPAKVYASGSSGTSWMGEDAWRSESHRAPISTPSRGKKRKSTEMSKVSPQDVPKSQPDKEIKEEDDFPDICDLVDEDLITPAMVKRRNAEFSSPRKSPSKSKAPVPDTTILTQRTVTQTVSTTETTIRRTASMDRSPSQHNSQGEAILGPSQIKGRGHAPSRSQTPRGADVSACVTTHSKRRSSGPKIVDEDRVTDAEALEPSSPSTRHSRKFQRSDVIVDSDDEVDELGMPAGPDISDLSFVTAASGNASNSNDIHGPSKSLANANGGQKVGTPSQGPELSTQRNSPRTSSAMNNNIAPVPMEIDHNGQNSGDGAAGQHGLESDCITQVPNLLERFKQRPDVLNILKRINSKSLAENSKNFVRSCRDGWSIERKTRIKKEKEHLRHQKLALIEAEAAHTISNHITDDREDLLRQLSRLYDADAEEDVEELEGRIDALNKKIKDCEITLEQKLLEAGLSEEIFLYPLDSLQETPHEANEPTSPMESQPPRPRYETTTSEGASENPRSLQSGSRPPAAFEPPKPGTYSSKPVFPDDATRASRVVDTSSFGGGRSRMASDIADVEDFLDDGDDEFWDQPVMFEQRAQPLSAQRSRAAVSSKPATRPRPRHQENFSDYGDGEGDDDLAAMVAMAEEVEVYEQRQTPIEAVSNRRARTVLSEASGNTGHSSRVKTLAKVSTKAVPKLRIPPEMMQHPWSKDVLRAFKDRFRLEGFRQNQLEAINATLAGQDAFVLMPTGGGKSLCYQLPAVINSGKTRGVTVVVTPLLSLMQDQVDHLTSRGIIAKAFNGDMDRAEKQDILQSFKLKNPEHHVQLLYVTPEMINKSTNFLNGLQTLYRNKKFARLVIDEAHCVSQWGHDFRPDYKELGQVRQQFPGVPIIALTATATENVIVDVKHNLSMDDCKVFSQSFNRPNLYYEVRQKEKQPIDRIADLINERYKGKTGIVYTLSRKQTEQIAKKLTDFGIRAQHYHAAMSSEEKTTVQREWQRGTVKVVVATIAFGMGIDKPDVRFVIHHYLPKSLEGYYQETGRAGRDGLPSDCYLFFSHGDIHQLRKFIEESDGNRAQKERQKEMLNRVVMFCENTRDCRRSQLLRYFSEAFASAECGMNCDNCKNGGVHEFEDRTKYAQAILQAVMYYSRLTMVQCTDYLSGKKKPEDEPQPFHGIAKGLSKYEINQIINKLAFENALGEENRVGGGGIAIQYFILGKEAASFLTGGRKCPMLVRHGGGKNAPAKTTKKKAAKKSAGEEARPVSTCISSPVRAGPRQSRKGKSIAKFFDDEAVAEDDEDVGSDARDLDENGYEQDGFVVDDNEDEDDYFDPPVVTSRRQRRQRTLDELGSHNPSITTGQVLDDIHEMMTAEFLERAKKLEEETRNSRGLRRPIFTEAQMKQMAALWADNLDKMSRISGIDVDKVNKFGSRFIPLVKEWHAKYLELMATDDSMATIPATAGPSTNRRGPPAHSAEFIDLLSDEEEDGDYEDQGVASKYFTGDDHDPDDPLERQLALSEQRFAATSQMQEAPSRSRSHSKKGSQGGKWNYQRKGGAGGGGGRSYSGVTKRRAASSTAAGGSRKASSGAGRSGAGRGAASAARKSSGSGIGLMPF